MSWSVQNAGGAGTIDSASGLFTGQLAGGNVTVTAVANNIDDPNAVQTASVHTTYGHLKAAASVVVVPGPMVRIAVTPPHTTLQVAQGQQFTALGYDSYGNAQILSSPMWSVAGGVGTITSGGLFTATTAGVGKIIATQNGISGSGSANVLAIVGGVVFKTTPQQPFARVQIRDVVDAPTIVDARVRGGGLRAPDRIDTTNDFWWDLSQYDGKAFHMYGVYAVNLTVPGLAITPSDTRTQAEQVLSKFAAPQFLPVIVPGSVAPATVL
jgi:hypothetical protein